MVGEGNYDRREFKQSKQFAQERFSFPFAKWFVRLFIVLFVVAAIVY